MDEPEDTMTPEQRELMNLAVLSPTQLRRAIEYKAAVDKAAKDVP